MRAMFSLCFFTDDAVQLFIVLHSVSISMMDEHADIETLKNEETDVYDFVDIPAISGVL